MKHILFLSILVVFVVGCSTVKNNTLPPSVTTAHVIQTLNDTKDDLKLAGEQNTVVAKKINKALTLAEQLDILLEQIESEAALNVSTNSINITQ